jgi:hypothetical protein
VEVTDVNGLGGPIGASEVANLMLQKVGAS